MTPTVIPTTETVTEAQLSRRWAVGVVLRRPTTTTKQNNPPFVGFGQDHQEFPFGNSPESAIPRIPAGIPGNYWILGGNCREFEKFS